jgi:Family of unknown function (DUF6152)
MKRFACTLVSISSMALLPMLAMAHHSAAMFDMEKEVTVKGTVKDFQYTNPHSWLIVVAPGPGGKDVEWSFETEGPSTLLRAGIKRSSVMVGDKVSMTTHPMKDGRPAGQWLVLTKSDGTILSPRGAPKAPPAAAH